MSSSSWRKDLLGRFRLTQFYYFSLIPNLQSMLKHGILPKNEVERRNITSKSFANEAVQKRRDARQVMLTNNTRYCIHDLVPLYLVPKTPTLFARKDLQHEVFFIVISSDVITDAQTEFVFTDGNAASDNIREFTNLENLNMLPWDVIKADRWNDFGYGTRKRNAEFLFYPLIPRKYFKKLVVIDRDAHNWCVEEMAELKESIDIEVNPNYFFPEDGGLSWENPQSYKS